MKSYPQIYSILAAFLIAFMPISGAEGETVVQSEVNPERKAEIIALLQAASSSGLLKDNALKRDDALNKLSEMTSAEDIALLINNLTFPSNARGSYGEKAAYVVLLKRGPSITQDLLGYIDREADSYKRTVAARLLFDVLGPEKFSRFFSENKSTFTDRQMNALRDAMIQL